MAVEWMRAMRGGLRLAVGLAMIGGLAACSTRIQALPHEAILDTHDPEVALVMIGERYEGPKLAGIFSKDNCPPLRSRWVAFGSAEKLKTMSNFESPWIGCAATGYNVYRVTPGLYGLGSTVHMALDGRNFGTTVFLPPNTLFSRAQTLKFTAAKGQITYLGTIVWGSYFPSNVKELKFDIAGATEALKSYPGIKGDLKFARFEALSRLPAGTPGGPGIPTPPPETPDSGSPAQ
jgi:hypothetical protein